MVTGEASTRPKLNTDSEIVSLFARPNCRKPLKFPVDNTLALYGSSATEGLLFCGFSDQEKGCFRYNILENNWEIEQYSLLVNRSHASSVSFGNGSWIITGGQTYSDFERVPILLETSEILRDLEFIQGPNLPISLSGHCSIQIDDNHIFIAGGYGDESHLMNSFILNITHFTWNYLPLMKYGRFGHTCGKTISLFNEIDVIVAGGLHQNRIEKFSLTHFKWFTLPIIEDQPIFKSATVQGETTFVITGGVELEPDCTTSNCRIDTIKIYDNDMSKFKKDIKRLTRGRGNHVATPMPINVDCSGKFCFFEATKSQ